MSPNRAYDVTFWDSMKMRPRCGKIVSGDEGGDARTF